jgi:hypothetical protein
METIKPSNDETNKQIQTLSMILAGLSLFYFLLFETLSRDIDASVISRFFLIMVLLFFSFFFSVSVYGAFKNNNWMRITAGFPLILWFAVLLFLNKPITNDINTILSSTIGFGLAWLLVIPLLTIPIFTLLVSTNMYKKENNNQRIKHWLISFVCTIIGLLSVFYPSIIFSPLGNLIITHTSGWLQVLFLGIFMGIFEALIVGPIFPVFLEISNALLSLGIKKKQIQS